MTNTMTDEERDAAFDSIQANVLERILGKGHEVPEEKELHVDSKFGTGKSWLGQQRLTLNKDQSGFGHINKVMHDNRNYVESFKY